MKLPLIDLISKKLEEFPSIKIAILFGSAAKNRLTPSSDIDIAVAAEKKMHFQEIEKLQSELTYTLKTNVDLIDLHFVSGPILQQALCTGKTIIKHSPLIFASLVKRMWFNQADMMPYSERILKAKCARFIDG